MLNKLFCEIFKIQNIKVGLMTRINEHARSITQLDRRIELSGVLTKNNEKDRARKNAPQQKCVASFPLGSKIRRLLFCIFVIYA